MHFLHRSLECAQALNFNINKFRKLPDKLLLIYLSEEKFILIFIYLPHVYGNAATQSMYLRSHDDDHERFDLEQCGEASQLLMSASKL